MPPPCELHSESPHLPATDCEALPRAGFLLILFPRKWRREVEGWYWNLFFKPWITWPPQHLPWFLLTKWSSFKSQWGAPKAMALQNSCHGLSSHSWGGGTLGSACPPCGSSLCLHRALCDWKSRCQASPPPERALQLLLRWKILTICQSCWPGHATLFPAGWCLCHRSRGKRGPALPADLCSWAGNVMGWDSSLIPSTGSSQRLCPQNHFQITLERGELSPTQREAGPPLHLFKQDSCFWCLSPSSAPFLWLLTQWSKFQGRRHLLISHELCCRETSALSAATQALSSGHPQAPTHFDQDQA